MAKKAKKQRPLTDAERSQRFKDMAREVEASEDPKAFEKAFKKVTAAKGKGKGKGKR